MRVAVRRPMGAVAAHVLAGFLAGVGLALGDAALASARRVASTLHAADEARVAVHLLGLYVPLTTTLAALLGICSPVLIRALALEHIDRAVGPSRHWFEHRPDLFSWGVSVLVGVVAFFTALAGLFDHFSTRYHSQELATLAMAAAGLTATAVLVVAVRVLARVLGWFASKLPRAASFAGLLAFVTGCLGAFALRLVLLPPAFIRHIDLAALSLLAAAATGYLLLVRLAGVSVRRWRRPTLMAATLVLAAAWGAGALVSLRFSGNQRVRVQLVQASVGGRSVLRLYRDLTDRDRDGYSWAFGGGDCDDADPNVYPGALDLPGDGVDADCFAGDGGPEVQGVTGGGYGELPSALERPNLMLITIDALRPDHLGSRGYRRATSPNLDRFAANAVVFEQAIAQSSRSVRSIPAVLTGLYPSQIAYGSEYLWPALEPSNVTVAELLQQAGYETVAVMGTNYFKRMGHLYQGFGRVDEDRAYKPPRTRTVARARAELRRLREGSVPWFLWVHVFHVHEPYLHDRARSRFGPTYMGAYDTELLLTDGHLGPLLEDLEELPVASNTVVWIASDHGEAFGEHGSFGHSYTLFEEELRSLLMVRAPGFAPRVVRTPVALMDLYPTLLNLAGIGMPRKGYARSLVPLMAGAQASSEPRAIFSELLPDGSLPFDQKAMRLGNDKLIWWVRQDAYQLYDLRRDPSEQTDLSDTRRGRATQLLGMLRSFMARQGLGAHRRRQILRQHVLSAPPARLDRHMDVRYPGRFTLLGYDLSGTRLKPGDRIRLEFFYRVEGRMRERLFFLLDFKAPPGHSLPREFGGRHYPVRGSYHTSEWQPGQIVRDVVTIVVPPDLRTPVRLSLHLSVMIREKRKTLVPLGMSHGSLHIADFSITTP